MKVLSKGYTLKVVSWENDGDNYRTVYHTANSKELALALKHMCQSLFRSSNNSSGGIGNLCDGEYSEFNRVVSKYIDDNPEILAIIRNDLSSEELASDDVRYDVICDIAHDLMGSSEYYMSRICESVEAYYVAEDVYAEVI